MMTKGAALQPAVRPLLATAFLLMVPLVAMQFTDGVVWDEADFLVAGILLFGTGLLYELAARKAGNVVYRAAVGLALATALLLVWANLAVGVIGDDDNPANAMYLGVFAVGIIGTMLARLRPKGMARAMVAMALTQALIAVIAVIGNLGAPDSGPLEIVAVNGFFIAPFVGSALLFRHAAQEEPREGAGSAA